MSAPVDHTNEKVEAVPSSTPPHNWSPSSTSPHNWRPHFSNVQTVKVSNISLTTSTKDIGEFFSFSGEIQYIEMQRENDHTQVAYVTFKETQGAETAVLLTGSKIGDLYVTITPVENYQLPPEALTSTVTDQTPTTAMKAEDVMSTMLAKGFILGKDAITKAKAFDERHNLSSNASSTVASIDRKIGLSDKLSIGTAIVNEKMRDLDERYRVSEKTKSAYAVAEQKASVAGSAIMSNHYVLTGASWFSSAFSAIAKAAEDVSTKTKEKVEQAEVQKKEAISNERKGTVDEFAKMHLESDAGPAIVPVNSGDDSKHRVL